MCEDAIIPPLIPSEAFSLPGETESHNLAASTYSNFLSPYPQHSQIEYLLDERWIHDKLWHENLFQGWKQNSVSKQNLWSTCPHNRSDFAA